MKVPAGCIESAIGDLRRLVSQENLRCRACGTLLEPVAEAAGPELFVNRLPADLNLVCPACGTRQPLRCDFYDGPAGWLPETGRRSGAPPRHVCPECGARMEPEGRCFFCRACGYSPCG